MNEDEALTKRSGLRHKHARRIYSKNGHFMSVLQLAKLNFKKISKRTFKRTEFNF